MKKRSKKLLFGCRVLALIMLVSCQAEARRVLRVSLYPYIPEPAAAALTMKQGFERTHPDVIVDVMFNPNYYSLRPEDRGVLNEDADVHEIDAIFMRDFLAAHKLQPPGIDVSGTLTPLARQAAIYDGKSWAVPHWMCADFLIYRSGKTALVNVHTLAALRSALPPHHGLLLDMKTDGQLGELYLSMLVGTGRPIPSLLWQLSSKPEPALLPRLADLLALESPGMGRNTTYGNTEGFYARQFARGTGSAFVGYSELIHDALDEAAHGCRVEDNCVAADQLRVAAMPFADNMVRPAVWIDMFGIDAKVRGATLRDARDFITYAVSLPAYRALLIPAPGSVPRYLLPATEAAFDDPAILLQAPLYPRFRSILDQGVVVTAPHLNATLQQTGALIDAYLSKPPRLSE